MMAFLTTSVQSHTEDSSSCSNLREIMTGWKGKIRLFPDDTIIYAKSPKECRKIQLAIVNLSRLQSVSSV